MTILMHERGDRCFECKGSGVSGGFDCEPCDGEGFIYEPEKSDELYVALSSNHRSPSQPDTGDQS